MFGHFISVIINPATAGTVIQLTGTEEECVQIKEDLTKHGLLVELKVV
jgi:hypothetical protein